MTDDELRSLVRAAIARQAAGTPGAEVGNRPAPAMVRLHPSHSLFMVPAGSDADGPCFIEPAVMCNHCGYCQSWGH